MILTKIGASRNAAGICNPTVLKRYTMAWEGAEFLNMLCQNTKVLKQFQNTCISTHYRYTVIFFQQREQNIGLLHSQEKGLIDF